MNILLAALVPVLTPRGVDLAELTLSDGAPGAPLELVVPAAESAWWRAVALAGLEAGASWAGRKITVSSPPDAAPDATTVAALALAASGEGWPADLWLIARVGPDGALHPSRARRPTAANPNAPTPRCLVAPGTPQLPGDTVVNTLADALRVARGTPAPRPPAEPQLDLVLVEEIAGELQKAARRASEAPKLPSPLSHEVDRRVRRAKQLTHAGAPGAWWAWMDAEALPYAWALTTRALGPDQPDDEGVLAAAHQLAEVMDSRLERHLAGPSDPVPAGRAGLLHGAVMSRAAAACDALIPGAFDDEEPLGAMVGLAESQARAELGSLYVTDTMLRRVDQSPVADGAPIRALLTRAIGLPDDPCLSALAGRLTAAPAGPWTDVDVAYGVAWILAQDEDTRGAEAIARAAIRDAAQAGAPVDALVLERDGLDREDYASWTTLAVRARLARMLVARP